MAGGPAAAVCAELDRLLGGVARGTGAEGGAGVAVSGGSDSTALLVIASRWARERGWPLRAATVDHRLRAESAAEAEAVGALCARLGVSHETLRTGDLRAAGGNLAAAAREARFVLLGAWAARCRLAAVLLGHTLDDQAETVLMRLARGSGTEGLAAMDPELRRGGVLWLRPILEQRRAALRAYLESEGIGWFDDPTNEDPGYDRIKARRALVALASLGIDAEGLAATAARLRRQRRVLERAMGELAARARRWGMLGEARLDAAAMAGDEPDTAMRLLADTLQRIAGAPYRPRFRALDAVVTPILAGAPVAATLAGCVIRRAADGAVLVCREPGACAPAACLAAGDTVWDNRWRVRVAGSWPELAHIAALGEPGLAALRKAADAGTWRPPEPWDGAPRLAQLTTPAVWLTTAEGNAELLAAPAAGYLARGALGPDCAIVAERIPAEGLPR